MGSDRIDGGVLAEAVDPGAGGYMIEAFRGKHILFLINDIRWFFSHRVRLASAVRDAGARVSVASGPSDLEREVVNAGFEFFPVALPRGFSSPLQEVEANRSLYRLYREAKPDLTHHVTMKPVLYGSWAARAARVGAVVNTIAGLGSMFIGNDARARLFRRVSKIAFRSALNHPNSRTIFQNDDDRSVFIENGMVHPDRAVMVRGSGVDITKFVPTREPMGVPIVVLVSRMLRDKGVGDFVEAAKLLKHRGVACRCLLYGDPDPSNPTSIPVDLLKHWHHEGWVEWQGASSDVPGVMARANVVVLPSYREGLPKVLLEAAASGRAIVTNDVPGCRDVVKHSLNGLLVTPGHPVELADAIETLCASPVMRGNMGLEGRRIVEERFSEPLIVGQTLRVYEDLLSQYPLCQYPLRQLS